MRVLVVEDEPLSGGGRCARDSSARASRSTWRPTAGKALWFARENEYDVILLDIMLPVLNGYKVCEQLRAEGNWTPILMLTAKDGDVGPGGGPRHRGRRLRDQAVLVRRCCSRGCARCCAAASPSDP